MTIKSARACAVTLIFAATAAAGFGTALVPRAAGASDRAVTLYQNLLPGIGRMPSRGPVSPSATIHLGVSLKRPDPAGEEAFLRALYDPSSSLFHHFLTPAQFNQRFGVQPQRFEALKSWLASGGLNVTTVPGSDDYVLARGTAAQVEELMRIGLRKFSLGGRNFYANTVAPTVPARLGISHIAGLNSLEGPRLGVHDRAKSAKGLSPQAAVPNTGLITPKELWSVYNQPDSDKGEGQSMAIFGWGVTDDGTNSVEQDLRTFEAEFGFSAIPFSVQYYGDPSEPITDTVGAVEWRLDTQASTGMAPNANNETMYFGRQGSDADILAAYQAWANDPNGPLQGSSSFSECEYSPQLPASQQDTVFQPMAEPILQQATIEGRTMFASTGDTGASCPVLPVNLNGVGTELVPLLGYPAASPFAVGVGGTVLYTDGNTPAARQLETAWTHTGGGTSPYIKAPDYQLGTTGLIGLCTTDEQGNPYPPGTLCRGIPDVAAISGDIVSNGYPITSDGAKDQPGGGTSLSSPVWLGMWTRLQAAAPTTAGKGFANPIFYHQGQTNQAADFFDIGGADTHTAVTCNLSPIYCSHAGWDYVSGWGAPHLQQLMQDVDGTTTPLCQTTNSCPALQPPPGGGGGPQLNPCSSLYTVPADDSDAYTAGEGTITGPLPSQLDILSGNMQLTSNGQTLKVTLTIADLNTTLPMGSGENDYRVLWNNGSTKDFALATVEPGGQVIYSDGQAIVTPATTRYQTLNIDTGSFGSGPNGVVEIDVPLANINATTGTLFTTISGETDIRNGTAQAGLLTTEDTGGPGLDYQIDPRNLIMGTAGNDTLIGTSGGDIICGLGGNDFLRGLGGNDLLLGGDGNDSLYGGAGNDVFDGGPGSDQAVFADSPVASAEVADLSGTAELVCAGIPCADNTQLGHDTFVTYQPSPGVTCSTTEVLVGTRFNDRFTGDACNNGLYGFKGNDTLTGGGGDDLLLGGDGNDSMSSGDGNDTLLPGTGNESVVDGGVGTDTVSYSDITTGGVTINVPAGTATGTVTGGAGNDSFSNMEVYIGTPQNDTLTGGPNTDLLYGIEGNDVISGGGGNDLIGPGAGTDIVDGGTGQDGVDYYFSASGTTVNLQTGTASDGLGGTDSLASIENVIGSVVGGDNVTGSDASNAMWGLGGDDTLLGGNGDDFLDGGSNDTTTPGDTLNGGPNTDTCLNGETVSNCEVTSGPVGAFSSVLKEQKVAVAAFRKLGLGLGPKRPGSGTRLA